MFWGALGTSLRCFGAPLGLVWGVWELVYSEMQNLCLVSSCLVAATKLSNPIIVGSNPSHLGSSVSHVGCI